MYDTIPNWRRFSFCEHFAILINFQDITCAFQWSFHNWCNALLQALEKMFMIKVLHLSWASIRKLKLLRAALSNKQRERRNMNIDVSLRHQLTIYLPTISSLSLMLFNSIIFNTFLIAFSTTSHLLNALFFFHFVCDYVCAFCIIDVVWTVKLKLLLMPFVWKFRGTLKYDRKSRIVETIFQFNLNCYFISTKIRLIAD